MINQKNFPLTFFFVKELKPENGAHQKTSAFTVAMLCMRDCESEHLDLRSDGSDC